MATGDLIRLGTFYKAGTRQAVPQNPVSGGDVPAFSAGQTIEIRDSDASEANRIPWREVVIGNKRLLIADRVLLRSVSWDDLNAQDLVTGKTVTIDGQDYKLRLLTGGTNYRSGTDAYSGGRPTDNEWDQIIVNESNFSGLPKPTATDLTNNSSNLNGDHNKFWNWYNMRSWVQEAYNSGSNRVTRGYNSARTFDNASSGNRGTNIGWRPALEVLNSAPLISGKDENLGDKKAPFSHVYNVTEPDGDPFTIVEKVNGKTVRTIESAVSGQNYEFIIDIGTWTDIATGETSTMTIEAADNKGLKATRTYTFKKTNQEPTVQLNTSNNQTLYENDILTIDGGAKDTDDGNIVNVMYQIDSGQPRALTVGISDGSNTIPFLKELKFKLGRLYDGDKPVTEVLADGESHKLKVWAEDNHGGRSADQDRTFYVVANRPPSIAFDEFEPAIDLINSDVVAITGQVSDPEGQDVRIRYTINSGAATEFHSGPPGPFTINIPLDKLDDGPNTIRVQALDSYDFVATKELEMTKSFNAENLLRGTARYEIDVPEGGVANLVAWIEQELGDLDVEVEASLILDGQQEVYREMELKQVVELDVNTEERDFRIEVEDPQEIVVVKITMNRSDKDAIDSILKVTGTMT